MKYRIEQHNLDGPGYRATRVYDMQVLDIYDFWYSVTDVACPIDSCGGLIRWAEAGYVPGYRICDHCKRHFLAKGNSEKPILLRVGDRRG